MPPPIPKLTMQLFAWYLDPGSQQYRLVQINDDLTPNPTPEQENIIVYPEQCPLTAGTFIASNEGRLFSTN